MKESLKTATRKWFQTCLLSSSDHFKSREIPSRLHSVADILVTQSSSSTVLPSVTVASASWEPVSWTCPIQMPHHMTHFDSEEQWLRDNLALVESPKASWSWLKSRPSAFAVIPMIKSLKYPVTSALMKQASWMGHYSWGLPRLCSRQIIILADWAVVNGWWLSGPIPSYYSCLWGHSHM